MSTHEAAPELDELIRRALDSRVADVLVSMPGEVVSYDPATKSASIKLGVKRVLFDEFEDQIEEEYPILPNVPVVFPGCGTFSLHFPLSAGDTGDVIFSSSNHADWRASGKPSAPGDLKPHNLSAGKFYPGLRHTKNLTPETDRSIGIPSGLRLVFKNSTIEAGGGSDFVVLAGDASGGLGKALSNILDAGALAGGPGAANFTAAKAALTSLLTGPGAPLWLAAVASSNLKADP